ncbi:uncharacterized protein LOC107809598 [Nicotiana tabacum]|uniref:Uncharacterized protein LOC107809598 n=1 Tax=Nicotiana tabacum TaxID=4097 RepID=A0AC58UQK4_TOBAC
MSSFGITSLAIMAVYYRFSWQMEGGEVPLTEMFGTFALSVGAAVADGPMTPFTDPASATDDHAAAHPHIKRRRDEDDPDSVSGQQGMLLRPAAALKYTGCRTH